MSEIEQIYNVVRRFNAAVAAGDARAMAAMKCPSEAEEFLDQFNEDELDDVVVDPEVEDPLFFDCDVEGDTATLRVAPAVRPEQRGILYLRKYGAGWRLCDGPADHIA